MLKYNNKKVIDCSDWDDLVQKTYNKPYCFQQQDGCQSRGNITIDISKEEIEDYYDLEIPFKINGNVMGVNFNTWLNTTVEEINEKHPESYKGQNILWWDRNFYPNLQIIANDMCRKGLIESGEYMIDIDW